MPKISVIVLAYNIENYLGRCLDSLVVQSCQDIEIIIIDDCSTDGTPGIAADYASKDPRIRIIRHPENSGILWGRKTGVEASTGDYIMFVDGDDSIDRNMCGRLLEVAVAEDADLVICGAVVHKSDGTLGRKSFSLSHGNDRGAYLLSLVSAEMSVYVTMRLYRKELWKDRPYSYSKKCNYFDDFLLTYECMEHVNKVIYIDEPLYHYYENSSSMSAFRLNERGLDNLTLSSHLALEAVSRVDRGMVGEMSRNVLRRIFAIIRKRYPWDAVMGSVKSNGLSGLFEYSALRDTLGPWKACYYYLVGKSPAASKIICRLLDWKDRNRE